MKRQPPTLSRKLEIEPLSEARWARVERAVFDAHAQATSATASLVRSPSGRPEALVPRWRLAAALLVLAGAVATIAGGLAWRAVTAGTSPGAAAAREGATRVETAANGSRVEFGESTIDVGPTSAVRLAGDDAQGVVVTLDRGSVECDVAPRRERPPFLVEAGGVEVRVIGTHFVVIRTGETVAVEVQRGEVAVTSGGVHALVPAGSRWPSSVQAPAANSSASSTPTASEPARDPGTREPGVRATEPRSASQARATAASPREQYDAASRLEASQPAAAVALYRDLARQGGAWGANALFAEGRLEADRGDQDAARRLLHDYLARYPGGPNANDA
ncbi:MAG TPA: FecR family protein, partial [Polyangiaceae bacterium]